MKKIEAPRLHCPIRKNSEGNPCEIKTIFVGVKPRCLGCVPSSHEYINGAVKAVMCLEACLARIRKEGSCPEFKGIEEALEEVLINQN